MYWVKSFKTDKSFEFNKTQRKEWTAKRGVAWQDEDLFEGCALGRLGGKLLVQKLDLGFHGILVRGDEIFTHCCFVNDLFNPWNVNDFDHVENVLSKIDGPHVLPLPRFIPRDQVGKHWRAAQTLLAEPGSRSKFAKDAVALLQEQERMELLLRESRAAIEFAVEANGTGRLKAMLAQSRADGVDYDDGEFMEEEREIEESLAAV